MDVIPYDFESLFYALQVHHALLFI
jgi:hypothetical protein